MQCKLLLLCRLATADLDREEGVMPSKVTLHSARKCLSEKVLIDGSDTTMVYTHANGTERACMQPNLGRTSDQQPGPQQTSADTPAGKTYNPDIRYKQDMSHKMQARQMLQHSVNSYNCFFIIWIRY